LNIRRKNHIEITSVAGSSNKLDGTKRDTSNVQGGTAFPFGNKAKRAIYKIITDARNRRMASKCTKEGKRLLLND